MDTRSQLLTKSLDSLPLNTAVVDHEGTILQTNQAWRMFGEDNGIEIPSDTVGVNYLEICRTAESETANEVFHELSALLDGTRERITIEYPCHSPVEQRWFLLVAVPFTDNGSRHAVVSHFNVTDYKLVERQLEGRRDQLAALDHLNGVIRETVHRIIDQSTSAAIERTVCADLAATDSYMAAWLGEVDAKNDVVRLRATAGLEQYNVVDAQYSVADANANVDADANVDSDINANAKGEQYPHSARAVVDFDRLAGHHAVEQALWTQEVQTQTCLRKNPDFDWVADEATKYDSQSVAAVPVAHEKTPYGVLCLYTTREAAFTDEEVRMLSYLGEIVGHAIAAADRKQALMSEEVIEIDILVPDRFVGPSRPNADWEFTVDHTIVDPDGAYLVYATTTEDDLEAIESIVDQREGVTHTVLSSGTGTVRLRFRATTAPIVSMLADHGWATKNSVIHNGDCYLTVQLPSGDDVRQLVDLVREEYPDTTLLARRQVHSREQSDDQHTDSVMATLTDRQQTVLKTAHAAGYFEWPRGASGEDVAESLGISPATFHQHLRLCQQKITDAVLADTPIVG